MFDCWVPAAWESAMPSAWRVAVASSFSSLAATAAAANGP